MNWKTWMERLAVALLVVVFALFFALALWRLTGEQSGYTLGTEAALSQRYDSVSAEKLSGTETELNAYSVREARQGRREARRQPDETELASLSMAVLGES